MSYVRIGILGTGNIGATLITRLSGVGHDLRIANSRGPDTINPNLLTSGAKPVMAAEVAAEAEVIICSIPFNSMPGIAGMLGKVPTDVVLIDTSNYYPARDGKIAPIDEGKVESVWTSELLGRPIAKAWNAIAAASFAKKATSAGAPGRIAIPVAADRDRDLAVTMQLVEETGFDAFNAGAIADSWRMQPGAPAYCTDLTLDQMPAAMSAADKDRLPARRDLFMAVVAERTNGLMTSDEWFHDWMIRLNRVMFM